MNDTLERADAPGGTGAAVGDTATENVSDQSIADGPGIVKPNCLNPVMGSVPAELRDLRQWVTWRYELKDGDKWTKVPKNPHTGGNAMTNNPATWGGLADAEAAYSKRRHDGIGFVFSPDDPYTGIDLDHCRDAESGALETWAVDELARLDSYAEVSPSRTGVHVIVRAIPPHCGKNGSVEIYDRGRYFAMTGARLSRPGPAVIQSRQTEIDDFCARHFPPKVRATPTQAPTPANVTPRLDDADILGKAGAASNGAKFAALYAGSIAGYASHSEADAALCAMLAFWTDRDAGAIDRLFRGSGLFRPDKWDKRHHSDGRTYGQATIDGAIALTTETYRATPASSTKTTKAPKTDPAAYIKAADAILAADFPEQEMIVPNFLPNGLTILAGRPKVGKSWLALQLAFAVASGGMFFGRQVQAGRVLYLALEDSDRRLQKRMRAQGWPAGLPCDFLTMYDFRASIGDLIKGHDKLRALVLGGGYRLVVIDTLGRALMGGDPNDPDLQSRALDPLQSFAAEFGIANLVLDHHRKTNGFDSDLVSDILGATAKAAIADAIWGLYREQGKKGRKLSITGRDLEDATLALTFDPLTLCYQCDGDANAVELTQRQRKVLAVMADYGNATLSALTIPTGEDKGNLYRVLQDLLNEGKIVRHGQGRGATFECV